jgi:hypothetical protein
VVLGEMPFPAQAARVPIATAPSGNPDRRMRVSFFDPSSVDGAVLLAAKSHVSPEIAPLVAGVAAY